MKLPDLGPGSDAPGGPGRETALGRVRRSLPGLALLVVVAAGLGAPAAAWCDLPFKETSRHVEVVVLAEYRKPRGKKATVVPVEIFKGAQIEGSLSLDPRELKVHRPRNGSLFLLALTDRHLLVRYIDRLGACSPVSVLPLHGGRLRGDDRFDYDNGSEPMTLEELRRDLARHLEGR